MLFLLLSLSSLPLSSFLEKVICKNVICKVPLTCHEFALSLLITECYMAWVIIRLFLSIISMYRTAIKSMVLEKYFNGRAGGILDRFRR